MKKRLSLLMGIVLVVGLSHGTFSESIVRTDNNPLLHAAPTAGGGSAACASAAGTRKTADLATDEAETAQQNDQQDDSFSDRIIHMVDKFAKLVMVI